ncbi:uncharacterized protein BCR38DRAFT_355529 [Pseudomassariella vexata]|uniref:F-box domain-containing protein n=1 Tax=Pseudomassariella vexata TaxID=1141098 RepID=A0A1Y2DBR6_9PEZI|nr:uncharacterized protein BCR38DRAFT_355529 [Pseudomassariella vexata]ORY56710.1 hypothetical protein BCR38DRAFT_355529 [Pseudomassariella vexata]
MGAAGAHGAIKDLPELPNDLFLLIISYLSPQDSIICRRVSKNWNSAFTTENASWTLMKRHFPRCREIRNAATAVSAPPSSNPAAAGNKQRGPPDWTSVFAKVARRYHYLRSARPREIEKINVIDEKTHAHLRRGVEPWDRVLRFNENTAPFQYRDAVWCYDDGLLMYPDAAAPGRYVAYDLETQNRFAVPFDGADRTVRRVRLACGSLVVEWCEREAYHQLNDQETVHRHFATVFDVRRFSSRSPSPSTPKLNLVRSVSATDSTAWTITFRSEWKIHFLGLPISRHDRFFSAHNSTHYALYLWQPNRSPWGEEEPLEQLTVWDISFPSAYRPSLDPTGARKPPDRDLGPVVVRRLSWRDLDFLGLRQRHTPRIKELRVDEGNVYVHEEDHRWLAGMQASMAPPRHHRVKCTGIPVVGMGPRWVEECCADGDVHMSFCPRSGSVAKLRRDEEASDHPSGSAATSSSSSLSDPSSSPSGREGDQNSVTYTNHPSQAPCWRHEEFPYLTVSEVVDAKAGIRIVARQCFMMETLSVFIVPRISVQEAGLDGEGEESGEVRFADGMWAELMGKGVICGDERWVVGEDGDGRVTVVRM